LRLYVWKLPMPLCGVWRGRLKPGLQTSTSCGTSNSTMRWMPDRCGVDGLAELRNISCMNNRGAALIGMLMFTLTTSAVAQTIVTITSPTNNAHFAKISGMALNITLSAQVAGPTGNTTVNYYANGAPVASANTFNSYTATWSNVAVGSYTLAAGANGGGPSSGLVNIAVENGGIALVNENAVWKYLDGGQNPGPVWFLPDTDVS